MSARIVGITRFAALSLAAATVGCSSSQLAVPEAKGLRLETTLSASHLVQGDSATATFRLTNRSPWPVTVHFGSGCQILPYVVGAGGVVVYPGGGAWGCTAVLTELTLQPGESKVRTQTLRAGAATGSTPTAVVLARGTYSIYAEVPGDVYLRSVAATLVVR